MTIAMATHSCMDILMVVMTFMMMMLVVMYG